MVNCLTFDVMNASIRFYTEDIRFNLRQKAFFRSWITQIASDYKRTIGQINFIFCSDSYLLSINKQFLEHDYFTDIITFDYSEDTLISGDIYISIDRVFDNASELSVDKNLEVQRVVIHGVLHLCGLNDKSSKDAKKMRNAENLALSKFPKKT